MYLARLYNRSNCATGWFELKFCRPGVLCLLAQKSSLLELNFGNQEVFLHWWFSDFGGVLVPSLV